MKSNIKKVETSCNHCGSTRYELVTTGVEHEYDNTTDDVFNVVKCVDCQLVYLNPRPDLSELGTIYPPNYYAYHVEDSYDAGQRRNLYYALRYSGIMFALQAALSHFFPKGTNIRVLEIGCGDGHMLNCFRRVKTHHVETCGVDLSSQAVAKAKAAGHQAWAGRFEDIAVPEEVFDLVYASHVIEHVPDPLSFVLKVRQALKPGGIFAFWTPNIDALDAKWFRRQHWGQYHFPRHWVFYTPGTVRRLAELTGFELVGIDFQPNGVNWVFTFHSLMKENRLLSRYADTLFPTTGWSRATLANFVRNGFFVMVDLVLKLITGQTSNMGVAFRKPAVPPGEPGEITRMGEHPGPAHAAKQ